MSGLLSAIISNAKTLSAQSQAMEITGKNLQNVGNSAYARQRVVLGDSGTVQTAFGLESMGVTALSIQSTRNSILDNQIVRELMNSGSLSAQNDIASLMEAALGETISTTGSTSTDSSSSSTGISAALDEFFNAASAAAANPGDTASKQSLVQAAQSLVDLLHSVDSSLAQIDSSVVSQIDSQAAQVNQLVSDIASLNDQIARLEIGAPGTALDLRDARQAKLEKLAQYLDFTTTTASVGNGQIQINLNVEGGGTVSLLDGKTIAGQLSYTGSGYSLSTSPAATTLDIGGGSLYGLQQIRWQDPDEASSTFNLSALQTSLDNLAAQLVESVNAIYSQGTAGTPNNFFRVDDADATLYTTAADIQLSPGLSSSNLKTGTSGDAGDNTILQQISDLASQSFATGGGDTITGTFSEYYNKQVTSVGEKVSSTQDQIDNSGLVSQALLSQRESASGVSMDEESANLILFQRAFQGTAHVVSIMDGLLDIIVNGLVR